MERKISASDRSLDESYAGFDPLKLFQRWFNEALQANLPLAEAMAVSTVGRDNRPRSRMILLKDYSIEGFTFYTNYTSRKAEEIAANPQASLLFFWAQLDRQIRIEGKLEKISRQIAQDYYHSRPRGSQISAHASPQSKPVASRKELEDAYRETEEIFHGKEVPLPENWGGYLLRADYFEFWQARSNRLHDRFSFQRSSTGWERKRLAP